MASSMSGCGRLVSRIWQGCPAWGYSQGLLLPKYGEGGLALAVRTDLAIEAHEDALRQGQLPKGVHVDEQSREGVSTSRVSITTEAAARQLGKPKGHYVTFTAPGLRQRDHQVQDALARFLVAELDRLLHLHKESKVLVIGLGNWHATPDALGPRVVGRLLVTRHLMEHVPQNLEGKLRSVAALAPGVLGTTGMETGEIVRAVAEHVRPDVVVAIDALAARAVERIGVTLQLADTGIHPGSGVGNHRAALNRETLGVPVIAIGVPTVVHAITIARDTVSTLLNQLRQEAAFYDMVREMDEADQDALIREVLQPSVGDLMVTPKEIDMLIADLSRLLSGALNSVFHQGIDAREWSEYD